MTTAEPKTPKRATHTKATREDWLIVARDALISEGIEQVRILTLADRLDVSRSSFYWYFKGRDDLLDALLDHWEATNTAAIIAQCKLPSDRITKGICNLFKCFVDDDLYNYRLDFAVREWARRSGPVRRVVDVSDERRLEAIRSMFVRHGYEAGEADIRARILYYMQIGYYTLELKESHEDRLARIEGYLYGFSGEQPAHEDVDSFKTWARHRVGLLERSAGEVKTHLNVVPSKTNSSKGACD